MDPTCLFCRIARGEVPAKVLYADDRLFVIQDTEPQAPTHVLVIPRKHIPTINDLSPEDDELVGEMFRRAALVAKERGTADSGYRTVFNCNRSSGQSIFHIHLHLLGGRPFGWPPG